MPSVSALLDSRTERALRAFRGRLQERFGTQLPEMVLFDSRAQGDHRDDSDADVAVFLQPVTDTISAQMDMASDAYAVFLDTDILIQPWAFGGTPEQPERNRAMDLLDSVQAEGIAL
ncbi:nucleotidyltransferase domain-containing protein [Lamprobacter modestohalophilus]|uniref:nucleotidyltransferase domain-containing protein n=1 Tax=Lamprobacter modestohalophilus TaxID=1064514 RepID=UPI0031B7FE3A